MGKNSNFIFTENTNTESGLETNILDDSVHLTNKIIQDSNLLIPQTNIDYQYCTYNVEYECGKIPTAVCSQHFDLLRLIEVNIKLIYKNVKSFLQPSCNKFKTLTLIILCCVD